MNERRLRWCWPKLGMYRPVDRRPRVVANRYDHDLIGVAAVAFGRVWSLRWKAAMGEAVMPQPWRERLLVSLSAAQERRIAQHAAEHEHEYEPAFDESGRCLWCLDDGTEWVP